MDFHSGPHSGRQTEELGDGNQITSLSRATLCCFHGSGYLADMESTECDTQSLPKSLHGLMPRCRSSHAPRFVIAVHYIAVQLLNY